MNFQQAHGVYSLRLEGHIVYCDYAEGFNIQGVIELKQDLLAITENLSYWVLYQLPEPSAGITQDAIIEMMNSYVELQKAGCLAVAIVERSQFVRAGSPFRPDQLTMPINIDKDADYLLEWLTAFLPSE
ncbi:hypothetical protein N9L48_00060 [Psychrosphaera sp.]|nr:hypothetical protein [Psychrosphaera sp.]